MSEIKIKHTGGFTKYKPTTGKQGHPTQTPGKAGNGNAKMSWSGSKK